MLNLIFRSSLRAINPTKSLTTTIPSLQLTSSYTTTSKNSTTVAELRTQASEEGISNRKKFMSYQPSDKTFELIDKLGLCTVKNPKFMKYRRPNQRKWENHVEFPILQFFAGAKTAASFPEDSLPEIAVVGRSNVGKSKLINSLCSSAVVRTSDRPGVTKQLNFYEAHDQFHLVDMPGYGFAYAKEEVKASWSKLIEDYLTTRKSFKILLVLVDGRHTLKPADKEFMNMLEEKKIKYQVVVTKCDLLVRSVLARNFELIQNDLKSYKYANQRLIPLSSVTFAGVNDLRKFLLHTVGIRNSSTKKSSESSPSMDKKSKKSQPSAGKKFEDSIDDKKRQEERKKFLQIQENPELEDTFKRREKRLKKYAKEESPIKGLYD